MNRKLSPQFVRGAVDDAVYWVANQAAWEAVDDAGYVDDAVYVEGWAMGRAMRVAVEGAMSGAVGWAMSIRPDHPNIDKFIMEIEQKWSAA